MPVSSLIDFKRADGSRLRHAFGRPVKILQALHTDEVVPLLRAIEAQAKAGLWAVGMVAYEAAPAFDAALNVREPQAGLPLAAFMMFDGPIESGASTDKFTCGVWRDETSCDDYKKAVTAIRTAIGNGDYYQANFTTRLRAAFDGDATGLFAALQAAQPDGYALYADFGEWQAASVSPELFFAWDPATRQLTAKPMKGTAARTGDDQGDIAALRYSAKEQAENLMIVDLLRNDLSRVAEGGSVVVPELFAVEALPTAWQMTSTVQATAKPDIGLADIFTALFPCGSVTGAPKIAAMRALAEMERSPRGFYCGALGVVQPGGEAIFNVGIRTVTVQDGVAVCGVGGGVTWDSTPEGEFAESRVKRRFLMRATASFDLLETLRLENGAYALLPRHLQRLMQSAAHFGFAVMLDEVQRALETLAAQYSGGLYRVRLLVSRSGKVKTEISALALLAAAEFKIILAGEAVDSGEEFLRHKTTERGIYEARAPQDADIFDALLFNERNEVTEFTRGNVAVKIGGRMFTPPLDCGLLPGARRAAMLDAGEMTEVIIGRHALQDVDEVYFINSLRGVLRVTLAD